MFLRNNKKKRVATPLFLRGSLVREDARKSQPSEHIIQAPDTFAKQGNMKVFTLDMQTRYIQNLVIHNKFVQLSTIYGTYAVAGHTDGILDKSWRIIEERCYISYDGENNVTLFVCGCFDGHENKVRLSSIDQVIKHETIDSFKHKEEDLYCTHCKAVNLLKGPPQNIVSSSLAEVINPKPFTAVVSGGSLGPGIVVAGHHQFKCRTCKTTECPHMESFARWTADPEQYEDEGDSLAQEFSKIKISRNSREDEFTCISFQGIAWPVSDAYKERKSVVDSEGYPDVLKPVLSSKICSHGQLYTLTLVRDDAIIHREASVKRVHLYNYQVSADCHCTVQYDGLSDLLLNLENKNLFDLDWLFSILDRANHSVCPVMTAHTTTLLARSRCIDQSTTHLTYHSLRRAYNCFLRLLEWNETEAFTCRECQNTLQNGGLFDVICDGIMMGCKKHYLQEVIMGEPEDPTPIRGTKHADRCPLSVKTRRLLAEYIGYVKGKLVTSLQQLADIKFRDLAMKLKKECPPVWHWVAEMGPLCNYSCRTLLIPFCSSSPLCGSFQVFRYPEVQQAIIDVLDGVVNIKDSTGTHHFKLIMRHAPILAKAIMSNMQDGVLHVLVAKVIHFILVYVNQTIMKCEVPSPESYGAPYDSPYEYFPGFPVTLGRSHYEMDVHKNQDDVFCRKFSGSHPTLSPGIFTVFCRHRVCLGFSLMTSAESPRTPFEIFLKRFNGHLNNMRIFYDNCCNLHQFVLNREPARFSETIFLIDRLHYQDHSTCTDGYNTNSYNSDPKIKQINTQVNEQANADLRNLSKQVSHMRPDNVMLHARVFLADRNRRVKKL